MFSRFVRSQRPAGPPHKPRDIGTRNGFPVGAGPGDPELLTVKATRLLAVADVVLHDSLVSPEILAPGFPARRNYRRGKTRRAQAAYPGRNQFAVGFLRGTRTTVVRLKGGDPSMFGRAAEELESLREPRYSAEVVPGISARMAAAAAAGISLTDRRVASQVLFSTFSRSPERGNLEWSQLTADTTLVLYMPGTDYAEVAERLHDSGLPADLPCVIVSRATRGEQQVRWTTVGSLAAEETLPAPALFIVGRVAIHQIAEIRESFWTAREPQTRATGIRHLNLEFI